MKRMIMTAKASLAALLALLMLLTMIPMTGLVVSAANDVIFEEDFESGDLSQWTASDMNASVKAGIGKDFSKGLAIGADSGKWSTLTHYFTVEKNSYYEISFDYFESTVGETVQLQVREQNASTTLYTSDSLPESSGQWVHYTGTFETDEVTDLRVLVVTDGVIGQNDKAFDNIVIRKAKKPAEENKHVIFADDFEDAEVGTSGQWEARSGIESVVKAGVGKDFSKGMVINGPKWSNTKYDVPLESYKY